MAYPANIHPSNDVERLPSSTGRLVRKTTVELVLDDLRARILSGALPPGVPLRQEALADELGVSRIPVREAIRILSAEGLIDVLPHKGAFVSMLSKEEVREFFDIRQRLEPWLLHEAVAHISDADLHRAQAQVEAMDHATADDWGALNWAFHELLYAPAGRPAALSIVRALHEKSERYFRFQAVNTPVREQAHREHQQLIDLCRHRQADKAQQVLEEHIATAGDEILGIVTRILDDKPARLTS
ncbi:GntR family transcriptional regulator [Ottowia thiooxydans]|uniref:GntR family transcriptional regulator n=1 Tax=Ottowia thiooxydans TaxID=219182 RepID=UPI000688400E|nr:GntR family transcriptional regulator [Ottowia thiooxydans]